MNRTITVFGVKGGVGQTFVSLNLAIAISKITKKNVVYFDLDSDDLASFIRLPESGRSIKEVLSVIDFLDKELLRGYLMHHEEGFDLLRCSPELLNTELKSEHLEKILSLLSEIYDYTIISSSKTWNGQLITLFDNTQLLISLMLTDPPSFSKFLAFVNKMKKFHYPLSFIKVVFNNAYPVKFDEIKEKVKEMGVNVLSNIPYDPQSVVQSLTSLQPVINLLPKSSISKTIFDLAEKLLENDSYFVQKVKSEVRTQQVVESKEKKLLEFKKKIHAKLLEELKTDDRKNQSPEVVKERLESILSEEDTYEILPTRDERVQFLNEMLDEVLGLGPLQPLLRDKTISEIMAVGKDKIYIERDGKIILTDMSFTSERQMMTVIERIVSSVGRRIDEMNPLCDARLSDGSRVNITISPISLDGPVITIRKFMEKRLNIDDLISFGTLSPEIGKFLEICVKARKNIIVSGGTGSGKTTLLNVLSSFISNDERIITIEDSAELKLQQQHIVRLESRPPNVEGKGEISIRRLVINALRMRPDRIIVGECRGGEALDMLQAMNTGHDGSLTTIHANSPRETLSRLETMVLMAGMELPVRAIREQIASAIDLVIQIARFSDGSRKITNITEITGMEGDIITLQDIFRFRQRGVSPDGKVIGDFEPCGIVPTFVEEIRAKGFDLDLAMFRR